METMSTTIGPDTKRYERLLAKTLPTVIKSEDENNRMLAIIEELMSKGEDGLTPEEDALLELLVDLVHDFEEKHYPLPSRVKAERPGSGRLARIKPKSLPRSSTLALRILSDAAGGLSLAYARGSVGH
jgi:HTH-type transcriptional regulator / antitoxin HigA